MFYFMNTSTLSLSIYTRIDLVHLAHSLVHIGRSHVGSTSVADHDIGQNALSKEAEEGLADCLWRLAELRQTLDHHLFVSAYVCTYIYVYIIRMCIYMSIYIHEYHRVHATLR